MYVLVLLVLGLLGLPLAMLSGTKQGKVSLNEAVSLPFTVEKENRVILLYFGYLGCKTICTPSLQEISSIYKEADISEGLAFYFINIAQESGDLDAFVHYFHKEFIGLQLSREDRQNLMKDLRAYSSESLMGDGEMSHTGYLYMIKQDEQKNFTLKAMYYTRPFDVTSIVNDIKKELK